MLLAFSMDTLYSKIHFPRGTFIKYLDNKTKELSHRGNLIERSSFISHKHPSTLDGIAVLLHKLILSELLPKQFISIVSQSLTLVSNAERKVLKSIKSELWNCLSYRGLPYLFEVSSQTFRNDCKISRSQPKNSTLIVLWPQKRPFLTFQKLRQINSFVPKINGSYEL